MKIAVIYTGDPSFYKKTKNSHKEVFKSLPPWHVFYMVDPDTDQSIIDNDLSKNHLNEHALSTVFFTPNNNHGILPNVWHQERILLEEMFYKNDFSVDISFFRQLEFNRLFFEKHFAHLWHMDAVVFLKYENEYDFNADNMFLTATDGYFSSYNEDNSDITDDVIVINKNNFTSVFKLGNTWQHMCKNFIDVEEGEDIRRLRIDITKIHNYQKRFITEKLASVETRGIGLEGRIFNKKQDSDINYNLIEIVKYLSYRHISMLVYKDTDNSFYFNPSYVFIDEVGEEEWSKELIKIPLSKKEIEYVKQTLDGDKRARYIDYDKFVELNGEYVYDYNYWTDEIENILIRDIPMAPKDS